MPWIETDGPPTERQLKWAKRASIAGITSGMAEGLAHIAVAVLMMAVIVWARETPAYWITIGLCSVLWISFIAKAVEWASIKFGVKPVSTTPPPPGGGYVKTDGLTGEKTVVAPPELVDVRWPGKIGKN